MRGSPYRIVLLAGLVSLVGCARPPTVAGPSSETQPAAAGFGGTLAMVVRWEPADLAPKIPGSGNPTVTKRLFNAQLALSDSQGMPRPYMAEALPQLNTESWRVLPDGRMETTYRLRPGLAWHDGQALTADDFVFAYRVYTGGLGVFTSTPQDQMEAVTARDPRTLVVHWRSLYADAAALIQGDLEPLPRHILEGAFSSVEQDPAARDPFVTHPYWTMEFVGAGPFRLDRWEPGSSMEGAAFDAHALGRPKIDRLLVRIMTDENTALSNILAGEVQYATIASFRFEHALVLRRDWVPAGKGTVLLRQGGPVSLPVQMRPEYTNPPALLDVRVRRALAHSIDRQGLNEGQFEGVGFPSEHFVPREAPHFGDTDRAIPKYAYDPRRSEQLMTEAGFGKDREGFFVNPAGERFRPDFLVTAGPEIERTQSIVTDVWRRAGFDVQQSVLSVAAARDIQTRHTFPGIGYRGGLPVGERGWTTAEVGSAANRWAGENRGGWSSPEYDRVWDTFLATLEPSDRIRQIVEMNRLLSEHLATFMLYFSIQVMAHTPNVHGVEAGTQGAGRLIRMSLEHGNIHEWELR